MYPVRSILDASRPFGVAAAASLLLVAALIAPAGASASAPGSAAVGERGIGVGSAAVAESGVGVGSAAVSEIGPAGPGWITWRDHGPDGGVPRPAESLMASPAATTSCPGAMGSSPARFLRLVCVTGSGTTGWTATDRSALGVTLNAIYPRLVALYGQPMHGHTVTIVPDASLEGVAYYQSWYQVDANGVVVPGSCRAEIHLAPADGRDGSARIHYLPHEVLHAFHGCQAPPTPAVEEGMAEAAATLVRRAVAKELGVAWDRPSEPAGVYATDSAIPITDQLNGPLMSAGRWTNRDGTSRPQTRMLYGAATAYWWTLWRIDAAFFRDWNASWRAQDRHTQSQLTRLTRVHRLAGELVPAVGFKPYATWHSQQLVMAQRHEAGLRLLCGDASTQRADGYMAGLVQVIATDAERDDRVFANDVRLSMTRPDGSTAFGPITVSGSELGGGFLFDAMQAGGSVAEADSGAYRLTAQRADDGSLIGRCWFVGGFPVASRLIVVAEPGQSVKVTVPRLVDGQIIRVTRTKLVGSGRVAVFGRLKPGIATIGLDGAAPTKVVPVSLRGAVVALSAP